MRRRFVRGLVAIAAFYIPGGASWTEATADEDSPLTPAQQVAALNRYDGAIKSFVGLDSHTTTAEEVETARNQLRKVTDAGSEAIWTRLFPTGKLDIKSPYVFDGVMQASVSEEFKQRVLRKAVADYFITPPGERMYARRWIGELLEGFFDYGSRGDIEDIVRLGDVPFATDFHLAARVLAKVGTFQDIAAFDRLIEEGKARRIELDFKEINRLRLQLQTQ